MSKTRPWIFRCLQFRLRTIFIAMTLLAVWLGCWFKPRWDFAQSQHQAVERVIGWGGTVFYLHQDRMGQSPYADGSKVQQNMMFSTPLRKLLGHDFFDRVYAVNLDQSPIKNTDLVHLQKFTGLTAASLKNTSITDAGLEHLRQLSSLKELDITGTNITELGKEKFRQALPNCVIKQ
jgi:hypothetical protein